MMNTTDTAAFVLPSLKIGDRFASRRDVVDLFDGSLSVAKNPTLSALNVQVMLLNDKDWNDAFLSMYSADSADSAKSHIALVFSFRTRRHVDGRTYSEYMFEGVFNVDKAGRVIARKANATYDLGLAA